MCKANGKVLNLNPKFISGGKVVFKLGKGGNLIQETVDAIVD